jgi:hypothetical protein
MIFALKLAVQSTSGSWLVVMVYFYQAMVTEERPLNLTFGHPLDYDENFQEVVPPKR